MRGAQPFRTVRALLVLLVVAGTCACGAPRSGRLTVVDPTALPSALRTTATTNGTEPADDRRTAIGPRAFFVDRTTHLTPVPVEVAGMPTPQALQRLLRALVDGPTAAQRARGLSTVFTPGTTLELTRLDRGTATVRVLLTDSAPGPDTLPLAAGQVVLTVTSVPGVERVALLDDGGAVPAPLPGGRLADGPVGAAAYRSLLATTAPSQ